jgi:hypothetical protein
MMKNQINSPIETWYESFCTLGSKTQVIYRVSFQQMQQPFTSDRPKALIRMPLFPLGGFRSVGFLALARS